MFDFLGLSFLEALVNVDQVASCVYKVRGWDYTEIVLFWGFAIGALALF